MFLYAFDIRNRKVYLTLQTVSRSDKGRLCGAELVTRLFQQIFAAANFFCTYHGNKCGDNITSQK
jgi:hypothetical protein